MGGCKGVWEGVITFRRCENNQGGVNVLERYIS